MPIKAIGAFIGSVPDTKWVPTDIPRDKGGRVHTNPDLETPLPGVYAVGDMREGAVGRVGVAVGEGQLALRQANVFLDEQRQGSRRRSQETEKAAKPNRKSITALITDLFALDRDNPWFGQTAEGVKPLKKKTKKGKDSEWDESKHPRVPAGSSSGGQFGEGGGGAAEGGASKPGKKGKVKVNSVKEFEDDKVHVDSNKVDKFIESWNEGIGIDPGEFHKDFTGGLPSTMMITHRYYEHDDGDVMENRMQIAGNLKDEDGDNIGSYTRVIDLKNHKADSSFFQMEEDYQGKGEGKTMLAANVAMYQELGLSKVTVHANIDVGGYAWAKYGYVPTEESWDTLRDDLQDKLLSGRGGSGGAYDPEEWSMMSSDNQDRVFEKWKDYTYSDISDSEIENWHESGEALNDAKAAVAEQYNVQVQWANNAIDKVGAAHDDIPWKDNGAILQAISVEYDPRRGDGRDDPEFTLNEENLPPYLEGKITDELWDEIEEALTDSFNGRADDKKDEMDPPNLDDRIAEAQESYWNDMSDRDKFKYAEDNGLIEPVEDEDSDSEPIDVTDQEKKELYALLRSDDPKAIWALSDAPGGKALLLGTDWNGAIDFKDKDTMTRFNAYVGRKKESAKAAA